MRTLVSVLPVNTFYYFVISALCFHLTITSCNSFDRSTMFVRSISGLQSLAIFEPQIADTLKKSLETPGTLPKDSEIRRMVEIYLLDFKGGYVSGIKGKDIAAEENAQASKNPICAYRLVTRVVFLLEDAVSHTDFSKYFGNLFRRIKKFSKENNWPKFEDVEDTIASILRLLHIYNLNAEEFANGLVHTIQTNCTLNSVHCYEISSAALKAGQFSSAIEWAELAREKSFEDKLLDASLAENALRITIEKHNYALQSSQGWEPEFFDRRIRYEPRDSKRAKKRRVSQYEAFRGRKEVQFAEINFWGLCAGDNFQMALEQGKLFCWYEYKIHLSFTIGPVKMEFLNRNPDVVQMYEVIYESEIKMLISEGATKMGDSLVWKVDSDGRDFKAALSEEHRASLTGWYDDKNTALPRKIERLTGLNLAKEGAGEILQVAAYSFGGYYKPHPDSLITETGMDSGGDRIATLMFYLNDVELGGSTVFTSTGVSAKPIKGSALLWYNVFSDGDTDYDTYHGACPVLLGQKWVSNKWILSNDQFLVRKCSLKRKERFRAPVNGVFL